MDTVAEHILVIGNKRVTEEQGIVTCLCPTLALFPVSLLHLWNSTYPPWNSWSLGVSSSKLTIITSPAFPLDPSSKMSVPLMRSSSDTAYPVSWRIVGHKRPLGYSEALGFSLLFQLLDVSCQMKDSKIGYEYSVGNSPFSKTTLKPP